MGRSLSWYIVSKNIEHDKSMICLDLEFEPPENDMELKEKFYKMVKFDSKELDTDDRFTRMFSSNMYFELCKEINGVWSFYEYNKKLCPKCMIYKNGFFHNKFVIDQMDVSHSYSNPIWWSEWCVYDLHFGSNNTNFIRRFSKKHLYYEVSEKDINYGFKKIDELGIPIHHSDIEAKNETMRVLNFLKKYSNRDDVYIIYQSED